jgi:hypothetical protein
MLMGIIAASYWQDLAGRLGFSKMVVVPAGPFTMGSPETEKGSI